MPGVVLSAFSPVLPFITSLVHVCWLVMLLPVTTFHLARTGDAYN
jgi:hypothetical protein